MPPTVTQGDSPADELRRRIGRKIRVGGPGMCDRSLRRGRGTMRRRIGLATLLVLAFGMANPAIRAVVGEEERPRPQILAHYMPWFESKPVSGHWGWHWTMGH